MISIVLPVYNGERYLKDSVQSVLAQNCDKFEVLICDDCSSDSSWEIISTILDRRVSYFRNEVNIGLFATLNELLARARYEIVHLWAQDDIMLPGCLERTLNYFNSNHNIVFAFSLHNNIDSDGKLLQLRKSRESNEIDKIDHAISSILYGCLPGNISNVTINKNCALESGGFNEKMLYSGDFDMWQRLSHYGKIGIFGESTVLIRSHSQQESRKIYSSINRLRENRDILMHLKLDIPTELHVYVDRCLRFRIYTEFTRQAVYLLQKFEITLLRSYLNELSKYGSLTVLFLHLLFNGILKSFALREKFEYWYFAKELLAARQR